MIVGLNSDFHNLNCQKLENAEKTLSRRIPATPFLLREDFERSREETDTWASMAKAAVWNGFSTLLFSLDF
jgi:hypothetical protein